MGLAKTLSDDQSSFSFQAAGPDGIVAAPTGLGGFFAPEVLREGRKTRMVDVFSLGCLTFFVLTLGGHPFELPGYVSHRRRTVPALCAMERATHAARWCPAATCAGGDR